MFKGSENADLIPSRHLTSFSMEKDGVNVKMRKNRVKKKMGLVDFAVIVDWLSVEKWNEKRLGRRTEQKQE